MKKGESLILKKIGKFDIADFLAVLGILLIAVGIGLIYMPMAFIFSGAMLFKSSLNIDRSE